MLILGFVKVSDVEHLGHAKLSRSSSATGSKMIDIVTLGFLATDWCHILLLIILLFASVNWYCRRETYCCPGKPSKDSFKNELKTL
jgi:hypothetical protein